MPLPWGSWLLNSVDSTKLADGAVTGAKLATASVDTSKLADGGVTGAKLADLTVTTVKIADGAITSSKITDGAIMPVDLQPGANNTVLQTNGSGVVVWASLAQSQIPVAAQNPGFTVNTGAAQFLMENNVAYQFGTLNKTADPLNMFDLATGTFTVPAGLGGVWEISSSMSLNGNPGCLAYSVNNPNPIFTLVCGAYNVCGMVNLILNPADVVRWFGGAGGTGTYGYNIIMSGYLKYKL